MKSWGIIADSLVGGWSLGSVSAIDSQGQTIWIVGAHRDDGKRLIMLTKKLSEFLELATAVRQVS